MKIISGGQTGVDRAALDSALELHLPCGGWCPKGRRAEDGPIDLRYPLRETRSADYRVRTERNVREADGTLVLTWGPAGGGTALTIRLAEKYQRPHRVVDLSAGGEPGDVREWMQEKGVGILNVAGPRESECPGVYREASRFLKAVLKPGGGT